jgi:murein DD-endopeptidase MepM/ murein hydrolase activator NlpD
MSAHRLLPAIGSLLLFVTLESSAQSGAGGGPVPASRCLTPAQYAAIESAIAGRRAGRRDGRRLHGADVVFADPMGGGTNTWQRTITNYVDHEASPGIRDFDCSSTTYDGHSGTDIEIVDFYLMDEGVPVLCAAAGSVEYAHDGEFDRETSWRNDATPNMVSVAHDDGTSAWYLHMRRNSVRVTAGSAVAVGDTLGFVGSSGYSSGPHLHFEVRSSNGTIDPYQGACQAGASRWMEQGRHVLEYPYELMEHGVTTMPLTWAVIAERPPSKSHVVSGATIFSWIRSRNMRQGDRFVWKFFANGSYVNEIPVTPDQTYSSSWWYVYWNLPSANQYYGEWRIELRRNDSVIGEQRFTYDGHANLSPTLASVSSTIPADRPFRGELSASDDDGSIFRYELVGEPRNGTIAMEGARNRRFVYVPRTGFVGIDSVTLRAIDDEGAASNVGAYQFHVQPATSAPEPLETNEPPTLSEARPNPSRSSAAIEYSLAHGANVRLVLNDALGREVITVVEGMVAAGPHTVRIDLDGLARGVYYCELRAGIHTVMRPIVVAP